MQRFHLLRAGLRGLLSFPLVGLTLFAAVPVFAQYPPPPSPSFVSDPRFQKPAKLDVTDRSLSQIALQLSQDYHFNVAVDGEPARLKATLKLEGTLGEVLEKFAKAFDYRWRPTRSGAVILTKAFQKPGNLPQMHLSETRQMVDDFLAALQGVPFDDADWTKALDDFVNALTPEQRAILRDKKEMSTNSLFPDQLRLLSRTLNNRYFGDPHQQWSTLAKVLHSMDRVRLKRVGWPQSGGRVIRGLELRADNRDGSSFFEDNLFLVGSFPTNNDGTQGDGEK